MNLMDIPVVPAFSQTASCLPATRQKQSPGRAHIPGHRNMVQSALTDQGGEVFTLGALIIYYGYGKYSHE